MDLLDEYKELLEFPLTFEEMAARRDALDAAILKLQGQRHRINHLLEKNCTHYLVEISKEEYHSHILYKLRCKTCGICVLYGKRSHLHEYMENHNVHIVNEL